MSSVSSSRTAPVYSPTSVYASPTSVYYSPPPVSVSASAKLATSPSAKLLPIEEQDGGIRLQRQIDRANQALQSRAGSGTEQGGISQQAQLESQVQGTPRGFNLPGEFRLTFSDSSGSTHTVYFSNRAEASTYINSLVAGDAVTYTSGGHLFGSEDAAQAYAQGNPIVTREYAPSLSRFIPTTTVSPTILPVRQPSDITQFSSAAPQGARYQISYTDASGNTRTAYFTTKADANAFANGEQAYLTTDGLSFISQQAASSHEQAIGQTTQAPAPTGITGEIEQGAATAYSDLQSGFGALFRLGVQGGLNTRGQLARLGIGAAPPSNSQIQEGRLLGISEPTAEQFSSQTGAYLFPGAAVLKGIGSPNEPLSARVFDIGVGVLPFIPFGEIAALGGRGASVLRFGGSFTGRTLIGAGVGAAGGLAYGESPSQIIESAAFGAALPNVIVGGSRLLGGIRSGISLALNPTRPLPEVEFPILSRYSPPEELSSPEFSTSPGQLVRVGRGGFSNVFVTGEDATLGIRTESDILESSVMSQADLARLTGGPDSFVRFVESRAPAKLPGTGSFSESLVRGGQEAQAERLLEEPTARAEEVTNLLRKYDQTVTQSAGQQETVLVQPKETELEPVSSEPSALQSAIDEARAQAEARFALTRAIARRRPLYESSMAFYPLPRGSVVPTHPESGTTSPLDNAISFGTLGRTALSTNLSTNVGTNLGLNLGTTLALSLDVAPISLTRETVTQETRQDVEILSLQRTAQVQVPLLRQEFSLYAFAPPLLQLRRRRKMRRRAARYSPTLDLNRVARNIAASFGDVGSLVAPSSTELEGILSFSGYLESPRRARRR